MPTIARYTKKFARYLRHTRAVSALEYAILVGVIAVAVAAALVTFSNDVQTAITNIGNNVAKINTTAPSTITPDTSAP